MSYNENIFLNEDADSYYLLGVYLTDGCMKENCVSLSSKDYDWLNQIKNIINDQLKLSKDGKNCHRFNISNKNIKNWLLTNGCIRKKSLTLECPIIPEQYLPDFLRGCIDGDGSISFKKYIRKSNSREFYSIHYTLTSASYKFISSISKLLNERNFRHSTLLRLPGTINSMIDGRKILHKNTIYTLTGGHISALSFLNWIYYPGHNLSLDRKKILAAQIKDYYASKI